MISSTMASTPPPPPPPVSTTVVCSRSVAVIIGHGNSPSVSLLLLRNEPVGEGFRMMSEGSRFTGDARFSRRAAAAERAEAPIANDAQPSIPAPGTGPNAKTPLAPTKPAPTKLARTKGADRSQERRGRRPGRPALRRAHRAGPVDQRRAAFGPAPRPPKSLNAISDPTPTSTSKSASLEGRKAPRGRSMSVSLSPSTARRMVAAIIVERHKSR